MSRRNNLTSTCTNNDVFFFHRLSVGRFLPSLILNSLNRKKSIMSSRWKISKDNLYDIAKLLSAGVWLTYSIIGVFYNGDMLHKIYFALVALTFFIYYKLLDIGRAEPKENTLPARDAFIITYNISGEPLGVTYCMSLLGHSFDKDKNILDQIKSLLLRGGHIKESDHIGIVSMCKV